MMKLRIYLDTSVISACCDERNPDRMMETREFWSRLSEFEVSTSKLVREEIERTSDRYKRQEMLNLLDETCIMEVTQESHSLASVYLSKGLFTESMYADAVHLAVSVLSRQDILVSWNFKHLVNRRKRAEIIQVNTVMDLPILEILSPPEM